MKAFLYVENFSKVISIRICALISRWVNDCFFCQIEAQKLPLTPDSLAALPPFASITFNEESSDGEKGKPEVAKTGLGSSAAMTTAVVAGLLHYLRVVDLSFTSLKFSEQRNVSTDLDIVHIIAQSAHCIAQGKVGSGFDVSAAVYGSQRYVRFSPEILSSAQVCLFFFGRDSFSLFSCFLECV